MPNIPTVFDKRYYPIRDVAAMFEVNASTLRFWEKQFPELKPKTNARGVRMYSPENIETLRQIYYLVKERGFTLKGAKQKKQQNPAETAQVEDVVRRLMKLREELQSFKQTL